MKVLVTGAYSSGKTSLCQQLRYSCAVRGWRALCPVETARSIDMPLNTEQNGEISALLVGAQMSTERALYDLCDVLICDRGVPDIWSHNLALVEEGAEVKTPDIEALVKDWSQSYDFVIQSTCNHDIAIPWDGIRLTDPAYRRRLEEFHRCAMAALEVRPNLCFDDSPESVATAVSGALCHVEMNIEFKAS